MPVGTAWWTLTYCAFQGPFFCLRAPSWQGGLVQDTGRSDLRGSDWEFSRNSISDLLRIEEIRSHSRYLYPWGPLVFRLSFTSTRLFLTFSIMIETKGSIHSLFPSLPIGYGYINEFFLVQCPEWSLSFVFFRRSVLWFCYRSLLSFLICTNWWMIARVLHSSQCRPRKLGRSWLAYSKGKIWWSCQFSFLL